jgi:hypothetical protein
MGKDLLITLEDKPGQGALLGETLGNAGVNIEGLCAITHEGTATVHVLVEDAAGARAALGAAGIKVEGETDVIVANLTANVATPGAFGAMARKLADAEINVTLAYLATGNRAVVATSDNDRAKEILGG